MVIGGKPVTDLENKTTDIDVNEIEDQEAERGSGDTRGSADLRGSGDTR